MMREILFRGKRIDNGEWVEGIPFFARNCCKMIVAVAVHPDFVDDGNVYYSEGYPVDPETVDQYTGLTDKNGKKIFEGDLLNGFIYPFLQGNDHNYFAEIVWFENSPAFGLVTHKYPLSAVRGISAGNADYMDDFAPTDWEIIGNIYDNPDILKEE